MNIMIKINELIKKGAPVQSTLYIMYKNHNFQKATTVGGLYPK